MTKNGWTGAVVCWRQRCDAMHCDSPDFSIGSSVVVEQPDCKRSREGSIVRFQIVRVCGQVDGSSARICRLDF